MRKNKERTTVKKKLGMIIACALAVAALGTGTAFAANAGAFPSPASLGVKSINVAPSKDVVSGKVMHIVKNGTHFYSVDGGEVWNDVIPDGFTLDAEGNLQKIFK
jgi:hypothetical protein